MAWNIWNSAYCVFVALGCKIFGIILAWMAWQCLEPRLRVPFGSVWCGSARLDRTKRFHKLSPCWCKPRKAIQRLQITCKFQWKKLMVGNAPSGCLFLSVSGSCSLFPSSLAFRANQWQTYDNRQTNVNFQLPTDSQTSTTKHRTVVECIWLWVDRIFKGYDQNARLFRSVAKFMCIQLWYSNDRCCLQFIENMANTSTHTYTHRTQQ